MTDPIVYVVAAPEHQYTVEASSGPAARASAPSERSVPSAAPRASAGLCAAASAVMHDTANAVETANSTSPAQSQVTGDSEAGEAATATHRNDIGVSAKATRAARSAPLALKRRAAPPCSAAIITPITRNIFPCCIAVYPNVWCVRNVIVNSRPE